MVKKHHVHGYEEFVKCMKDLEATTKGEIISIYFCGSKEKSTGASWCSDCVRAWPVIEKELANADPNSHFVYVEVGDREIWKNPNNPFRKDTKTKVMSLPTLLRWKAPQRLDNDQCEKPDLVEMFFTDED